MELIIIVGTSSETFLVCLYLQVLLPYLQVSYCSFDKVSLSTLGGELDSFCQGYPGSRLKLKNSTIPHGGDAGLLNAAWGSNKNTWRGILTRA